eukprot:2476622-Rhodomonas_salina.1
MQREGASPDSEGCVSRVEGVAFHGLDVILSRPPELRRKYRVRRGAVAHPEGVRGDPETEPEVAKVETVVTGLGLAEGLRNGRGGGWAGAGSRCQA